MKKLSLLCVLFLALPALGKPPKKKRKTPAPVAEPSEPSKPVETPEPPSPAETPAPTEPTKAPEPAPQTPSRSEPPPSQVESKDLDKLRVDYEQLRDQLFRSRARAQTLQGAVYSTKLTVSVRWKATRHFVVKRAQIRLDEAQMWDSGDRTLREDRIKAGEQAVAPGRHDLTVHLEVRAKDNDKLGYSSEHTFALDVPEGKKTSVDLAGDEDGDLPEYKPVVKMEIKSEK